MFGIGGTEKKRIIGMAVTPNLGIEACIYNRDTGEVVKYAQRFLEYNIASKEIQDIDLFRNAVSDLLNELEVPRSAASIFLVLPNVHFGFRSFDDSTIDNEAIESMIISEAGESYIFKQEEPISAWIDMNAKTGTSSKYIAHTSFQKKVVDAIQDAIMDIGATIIGIESSATAIPRGVGITKLCEDVIEQDESWDILLINPNGYTIFQMKGSRTLDYVEVPFAIMSFEGDEVYPALASAISQFLPNYPAKKLVVNSLTDNVSAKILKDEIIFDEKIVFVDSNKYGRAARVPLGQDVIRQIASSMSLCVLAASSPKFGAFPVLNILGAINYDGETIYGTVRFKDREYEITSGKVFRGSLYTCGALLILGAVLSGLLFGTNSVIKLRLAAIQKQVAKIQSEVDELNAKLGTNVNTIVKQIMDNNKVSLNYYDSLSTDIPPNVWLTYYINKNGKSVGIEGFSLKINDIYEYYKSLKVLAPQSDIKLNKLEVFKDEDNNPNNDPDSIVLSFDNKQQVFSFEISNTTYSKAFDDKGNRIKVELPAVQKPADSNNAASSGKTKSKSKKDKPKTEDKSDDTTASKARDILGPTYQEVDLGNEFAAKIPVVPDVEINLKEIK